MEKFKVTPGPDTFQGYKVSDLQEIFNVMADPKDWRAPIDANVRGELVNITVAAIIFYTATTPRVVLDLNRMRYLITSEGYRNGPAGDH